MASPMNSKRFAHGLGVITIDGEVRLAAFGGSEGHGEIDSIEVYFPKTERWSITNIKMKDTKSSFGFLSLKLSNVISML